MASFPEYGKLSGRNPDELLAGARIEPGEEKRHPADFALWKASKPGEPSWESPWGPGRPGWHIECSAMAQGELGFGFDIHGGGLDLVFPHHENEIAQAEAAAGSAPFARYWLHNGMVNLRGEKMAKSTGNVVSLLDLLDRFPPLAVRLFYLRAHYRAPLDFFEEALADSAASLERLWAFRRRAGRAGTPAPDAVARFAEAMDDDFNTAAAMGVLFDLVRDGHRRLDEGEDAGPQAAAYDAIIGVLGLAEPSSDLDDLAPALAAPGRRSGGAGRGAGGDPRCPARPEDRGPGRTGLGAGRPDPRPPGGPRHRSGGRARWHSLAPALRSRASTPWPPRWRRAGCCASSSNPPGSKRSAP